MKDERKLKPGEEIIQASCIGVEKLNSWSTIRGGRGYNIICEWIDPSNNEKYTFKECIYMWINPKEIMEEKNITSFSLCINAKRKVKYWVDLEDLKKDIVDLTNTRKYTPYDL